MRFNRTAKKVLFTATFGLCLGAFEGFAQKREGSIQDEAIEVEKTRKIELQPQVSRGFDPLEEAKDLRKDRKMKYDLVDRKWEGASLPKINNSIVDPREGDELTSSYGPKFKNVFKVGAGNYGHTLMNAHFGFTPNENSFHGLYINHDANRRGPVATSFSGRNENEIKVYSKTFTPSYLLNGSISYKRVEANWYGKPEAQFNNIANGTFGVYYDRFNYVGSISSAKKDAKFDYIATSGLTMMSTSQNEREWIWDSKIQTVLTINDNLSAHFSGDMTMSEYASLENNRRELYRIKPSFFYKNDRVSVHAGINVVNEKDKLKGINTTSLFPVVKLDYKAANFIHFFAGLGGDTYFNTLSQMASQNPWLRSQIDLRNTAQTANVFGGFKGSNERSFDFEFKFMYSEFTNLSFFVPSTADSSKYTVIYAGDLKKAQVMNFSGQFNYQLNERFLSVLKYDINQYENLGSLEKAYHRPAMNISFTNSITFKDKIIISPDVFYMNGLYGLNPRTNTAVAMKDIIDLNLKVNYLITKKFNAAVSANNLLGKNYERYLFYPSQGLNYTVSVAYSF
ncbi:hypothetical protein EWU23_02545 [Cytophagaceae bacterium 50C-KIRBA]|uniref:TonB-dependent receptor n=1 Tax=Aquirufa beregesia TaxID=2516556 RepID=A0ABX0ESG8_9BACT|nr:hypothetical protein [Aquirufa beregesia]NGZ43345.1 hypothetical protein [Aquirufa beregesia]